MASIHTETRAGRLTAIFFLCFSALVCCLFRMQIIQADHYRSLSEKNRIRLIYLEGPRGRILDRNGIALASNRLSFNCTAFLKESRVKIKKSIEHLAPLLGEDAETILTRYQKMKAGVYNTVVLAEDIPADKAISIEEQLHQLPGLMVETRPQREYPLKETAAHVTGFIGPQTAEEEEDLEYSGYRPSDWIGRDGLEKFYESYLRGHSGGLQLEVNNRGQYIKVLGVMEPREGRDIQLTVDAELQAFAQKQFQGKRGAAIVMDLSDGGILAMNSSPTFDPNLFASTRGRKLVGPYLDHEMAPMLNRGIQGVYPPGSIFKIVTGLAALEGQKIQTSTTFFCPGFHHIGKKVFRCWNPSGHGTQNLTEAYAHSCDVFFYLTGLAAGPDAISRKAVDFGYSLLSGVDLPGERKGSVPSPAWKLRTLRSGWYDGDTLNFAIGQGYLQVTPMQALEMISTIATGGERLKPHFVQKIDGIPVAERHSQPVPIKPEYLAAVRKGLEAVVNADTGTGRMARIPGVKLAGKTGTAEATKGGNHAWYVGYAPMDKPKIAFVVFLEHGGHGGVEAAAIAKPILQKLKDGGYL